MVEPSGRPLASWRSRSRFRIASGRGRERHPIYLRHVHMVLSIKDPEADQLARQLARMTGESITEAVKTALRDRLEHEQRRRGKKLDRARIDRNVAGIAALPVADARAPDELVGYDDAGLPTR
jgi:antitoxin VapB